MNTYWTNGLFDTTKTDWQITKPSPEFFQACNLPRVLSQINRWSGHTLRPYSVAEHCLLVAALSPVDLVLPALLHDAGEAITGDIARPWLELIGRNSPLFARLHTEWHDAAFSAWNVTLSPGDRLCLALADNVATYIEAHALVGRMPKIREICPELTGSKRPAIPPIQAIAFANRAAAEWELCFRDALLISTQPLHARSVPLHQYLNFWKRHGYETYLCDWIDYLTSTYKRMRSV